MKPDLLTRLPEILFQIGKAIGSDESLSHTLSTISKLVTELTDAEACSIMLAVPERKELLGKAAYGLERDNFSEVSFRYGEGVAGWVAEREESVVIDEAAKDKRYKTLEDSSSHIRSIACVPLVHKGNMVGVLTITSPQIAHFDNDTVVLLQLIANTIALDIENIRLQRLSVTDRLTGAYNREFLAERLPLLLAEMEERGTPLSVAMFDVDHFKKFNDDYGHDVGDLILADIARHLRESARERDILVRYGGEEFLLLLPRTNVATATDIADRMRVRLQDTGIRAEALTLHAQMSAGVAEYQRGESPTALIKRADTALYRAKANGRNRVEVAAAEEAAEAATEEPKHRA